MLLCYVIIQLSPASVLIAPPPTSPSKYYCSSWGLHTGALHLSGEHWDQ